MRKAVRTQSCPECGSVMRRERRADMVSYKGKSRTVRTLAWWCTKCDEAILAGDALIGRQKAFSELKAEVEGVLGPKAVAKIRTELGISQRKAGELLGGGPRSFQKYESGSQALSVPMSHLLRLLAKDPSRLRELERPRIITQRKGKRAA